MTRFRGSWWSAASRRTVPSEDEDLSAELSEAVRAALDGAVRMVESLLDDLTSEQPNAEREGLAMNRTTVLLMAILGMMAAAVAVQWPEIQRYLKVRQM